MGCRAFATASRELHGALRVQPAPIIPDLSAAILERTQPRTVRERVLGLRICIALVAIVHLATAAPMLLLGNEAGASVHAARHAGAFGVALAVGLLTAAWNPARAAGLLPVAAALGGCVLGGAILDVAAGRTGVLSESSHAIELVGLAALWVLHRAIRPPRARLAA